MGIPPVYFITNSLFATEPGTARKKDEKRQEARSRYRQQQEKVPAWRVQNPESEGLKGSALRQAEWRLVAVYGKPNEEDKPRQWKSHIRQTNRKVVPLEGQRARERHEQGPESSEPPVGWWRHQACYARTAVIAFGTKRPACYVPRSTR